MKMRALLRYRQIPYLWVGQAAHVAAALKKVKVPVIPVLEFPDGHFANDSTPLLFELEKRFSKRSVLPSSPALAFLACLFEDMADEWGTKIMFEYRWRRDLDQEIVSKRLAYDMLPATGADALNKKAHSLKERQVSRMELVGCTPENQPLIERSFEELLGHLEVLLTQQPYLFGSQPSLADFALYGQLQQLNDDPTPRKIMQDKAVYTARWVDGLSDASGIDGQWTKDVPAQIQRLSGLIDFAAQVYLPFLDANAKAVATGAEAFNVFLLGMPYQQAPFKYQVKCFIALRERYSALNAEDKALLKPALEASGALKYLPRGRAA